MKSPIKYYGGKGMMASKIIEHFPQDYEVYLELFGGGGSILFSKNITALEVYNDINRNVYSLFKVISDKEMFERFKERLDLTFYSCDIREEYKEFLKNELSMEDRAFYYFYVNRTSFNGNGGFTKNLCVRRNMAKSVSDYLSTCDALPEMHNRLSKVVIDNKDALKYLNEVDSKYFIYCDPPYVHDTRVSKNAYENEMSNGEHELFVEKILKSEAKILLSGYENKIYERLDEKFSKVKFKSTCSEKIEALWKNY